MRSAATIVGYAVRESVRRRVFLVILVLTALFLALYAVGTAFAFDHAQGFAAGQSRVLDPTAFTGATMLGLAMFATLFLGAVVATFLTLGVVRGDAESGLLQPLVVRPLGRRTMLLARFGGAGAIAAAYTLALYALAVAITAIAGGWTPDHVAGPGLGLALGVVIIAGISVLFSVFLAGTAQGIAIFMLFGSGLVAGLLGQIGRGLGSHSLESIGKAASWVLPFEALYQSGLHALISSTQGLTGVILNLGPFGGAQAAGPGLVLWSLVYSAIVLALACAGFARRDL